MVNQLGHQSKSKKRVNALIISTVTLSIMVLITYVVCFRVKNIQLNDLLYVSLYFTIAIFSSIIYFLVNNIWVRCFLIIEFCNFVTLIMIYAYNFIYGNEQFINLSLSLSTGLTFALTYLSYAYIRSRIKS